VAEKSDDQAFINPMPTRSASYRESRRDTIFCHRYSAYASHISWRGLSRRTGVDKRSALELSAYGIDTGDCRSQRVHRVEGYVREGDAISYDNRSTGYDEQPLARRLERP